MKKIIMVITILLLTGCSANYNLDLTTSKPKESLNIIEENNNDDYFDYLKNYNELVQAIYNPQDSDTLEVDPTLKYYDLYNMSTDNKANLMFEYSFNNKELNSTNIIKTCYEEVLLTNNSSKLDIKTSPKFLCFDKYITLDSVLINIKTDKKIINNNADSINGNVYTWNINKDSAQNKPIILSSVDNSSNIEEDNDQDSKNFKIVIITVIGFIILIIGIFIYKNHKYNRN